MQLAWRIAGSAFAVLFAVWAFQSWQLSLQDALGPGPGFFPFCLSIIGAALAIALAIRPAAAAEQATGDESPLIPAGDALRKVVVVVAALIALAVLLEVLGYRITVAAFCAILLYVLGARRWWVIVVFALAASVGVHALFSDLLKVPLPLGILEPS